MAKKGRKPLPRDPVTGVLIGSKDKKRAKRKAQQAQARPQPAPAPAGDEFLSAAVNASNKIQQETAEILADQTTFAKDPEPAAPEDPAGALIGQCDLSEILEIPIKGVGAILAQKTQIQEMSFTDDESKALAKATSDILNVIFPDMENLDPREKAILTSSLVILNVGYSKFSIYQAEQLKKIKQAQAPAAPQPAPAPAANVATFESAKIV